MSTAPGSPNGAPTAPAGSRPALPRSSFSVGFLSGLGGQVLNLLFSFPTSILLARILGPAGKGELDLALLLPAMVTLFASLGLGSAGSYLVGARAFPPERIVATLTGVWLVGSGALLPVYLALARFGWLGWVAPHVRTILLIPGVLLIALAIAREYWASVLLGAQRFVAYNSLPAIFSAANFLGVILLVWWIPLGAPGGLASALSAQTLCLIFLFGLLRELAPRRPRLEQAIVRQAVSYGVRGQVGNVLQFFNYRLDTILMGHFRGLSDVGLYTLAVSLAEFLWYVPNASALVIFPRTASSREEARTFTPLIFRVTGYIMLVAGLGLGLVGGPFIAHLYGPSFVPSIRPFLLLLPGVVCLGGAKILSADLLGRGVPEYNTLGALISLTATVTLDLMLIPKYGPSGAAVASSTAYFVTLVYTLFVYLKISGARLHELGRPGRRDLTALRETILRLAGLPRPRENQEA